MARGGKKITIYTHAAEHPGHFRVDDGILLCVYCNHTVKWEKKSTVDDHVRGPIHCAKKRHTKTNEKMEKFDNKEQLPQQFLLLTVKKN